MELSLLFTVICLSGFVISVPVTKNYPENKCTYECSNDPQNLLFELGKTYVYNYEAKTILNVNNEVDSSQMRVNAKAEITALSPCEHSLQLKNVVISGIKEDPQMKRELEERTLLFSYDNGKISSVCADPQDPLWVVNVKKALLSSLQISLSDLSGKHTVQEKDIMGNCKTTYETKNSSWKGIKLRKTKQVSSCSDRQRSIFALFPPKYTSSKNSAIHTNPLITNDYSCDILVKNRLVNNVKCTDKSTVFPLSFSKSNVILHSQIELAFESSETARDITPLARLERSELHHQSDDSVQRTDEEKVASILRKICENVHDEINSQVPTQFTELIQSIRSLPHQATYRIWKSVQRGDLCTSRKLQDIFIDALAMDASEGSVRIIVEMINNKEVNSVQANYWLTLLAFSNKPSEEAIKATLPLVKNQQAPRQSLLGVSSMIQNYCRRTQTCRSSDVVQEVIQNIVRRVPKACSGLEDDVVVALRAIYNVAPFDSSFYLIKNVFTCLSSQSVGVQRAAIESLENYACEQSVSDKLFSLFQDREQRSEIRITAYKSLISCPKQEIVKKIMSVLEQEKSEQVGSYVVSHIKNIHKTSDPFKQTLRDILITETVVEDKFPKDIRKYSRNYELSHLFDKVNSGTTVEADVIYDQSIIPRSFTTNITLPIFGSSFNIMEVGVRQEGLEKTIESLARSDLLKRHNFSEFVQTFVNLLTTNEIKKSSHSFKSYHLQKLRTLRDQAEVLKKNSIGTLYIKIDGKYIAHLSLNDISKGLLEDVFVAFKKSIKTLTDLTKTDRAFSFMLHQSVHEFPGANGFPLRVKIDAPIVLGYKQSEKGIFPSFASELSLKLGYVAKNFEPSAQLVSKLSSALAFSYEYKDDKRVQITLSPAKNDINIFSYQSNFFVTDEQNNIKPLKKKTQSYQGCSKSLSKFFGVELCSNLTMLKPVFSLKHPLVLLNGQFEFGVSLRKTDLSMKGWQLTFEMPQKESQGIRSYHIGFNTPGSTADREISAELQLTNPNERIKGFRVILKSPFKKLDLSTAVRYDERQISSKVELLVDQLKYKIDGEITREIEQSKIKFSPKLRIEMPTKHPVKLDGEITITYGRRSSINIDLKIDNGKPIFFGVRLIKESSKPGSTLVSIDVKADLGFIFFRINGYSDKQKEDTTSKVEISYIKPNSESHVIKIKNKLQNLSQRNLQKFVSFVEVELTEFPELNFHFSWNILHKSLEHLENEIIFMWKDDYKNSNRKIHFLQVSKFTGIREMKTMTVQNLFTLSVPSIGVDHEFRLTGHVDLRDASTHRFKMVSIEMSSKAKSSSVSNWAHVKFQNPSVKPMIFSFDAHLKTSTLDLKYSDKLEEVKPNHYYGSTKLSWGPLKQATLDYIFIVKSDNVKQHIEAEAEIRTLLSKESIKFKGLYRREQKELELRSTLTKESYNLLTFRTIISGQSKSKIYLEMPSFTGAIGVQLIGDKTLTLYLNEKNHRILHDTNAQLKFDELIITSVTTHKERNVFTLNTYLTKTEESKVSFDVYNFVSVNLGFNHTSKALSVVLEVRSVPYEIDHYTYASYEQVSSRLESRTKYMGENLFDVKSLISTSEYYFNIYTPRVVVKGNGKLQNSKGMIQISARETKNQWSYDNFITYSMLGIKADFTLKEQEEILSGNLIFSLEKESSLKITTRRYKGAVRFQLKNERGFWITIIDKQTSMRHQGSVEVSDNGARLSWNTEKSNIKILALDGVLEKDAKLSCEYKDTKIEIYFKRWNELRLNYENNKQSISHKSLIKVNSDNVTFYTLTTLKGQTLLNIDSKFSKLSYIKIRTNTYSSNLELESDSNENKKIKIEFTTNNSMHHVTNIKYTSIRKLELNSITEKESKTLLELKALLDRSVLYMEVDSEFLHGLLEMKGNGKKIYGRLDIEDKLRNIHHSTDVAYEPMKSLVIISRTENNNEKIIEANINFDVYSKSFCRIIYKKYIVSSEYESSSNKQELKFLAETKDKSFQHKTQIVYKQATIEIDSLTNKHGLHINVLSRINNHRPSHVKITSDSFECEVVWSLYSKVKTLQMRFDGKNIIPYNHFTDIEYKPLMLKLNSSTYKSNIEVAKVFVYLNERTTKVANVEFISALLMYRLEVTIYKNKWTLKSNTTINKKTVEIHGQIALKEKSYLNISLPSSKYIGEIDIYGENKIIKIILDNNQYRHETLASYKPGEANLISKTLKYNISLYDFNFKVSKNDEFLMQLKYLDYLGSLKLNPFGDKKKVEVELQTPKYSLVHISEYNRLKRELQSKSLYQGSEIYELNISWLEKSLDIIINTSMFRATIHINLVTRSYELYYVQEKNIIFKVSLSKNDNFLLLLQWDAEKNPNQKIMLQINKQLQRNSQKEINFILNMNKYEMKFVILYGDLIKGPHHVIITTKILDFEKQTLKLYHEIKGSRMKCNIEYFKGLVRKYSLDIDSEIVQLNNIFKIDGLIDFKSKSLEERGIENCVFKVNGEFLSSAGRIISNSTIGTKKVYLEAEYVITPEKIVLNGNFKPEYTTYEMTINLDRNENLLTLNLRKDKQSFSHLEGMLKYKSFASFIGSLSVYYQNYFFEALVEGSQDKYSFDAKLKRQSELLASTKVLIKNQVSLWSGKMEAAYNGANIVLIDFNQKKVRGGMVNQAIYKTPQVSYNILYTSSKSGDSKHKKTLELCEQSSQKCYSLEMFAQFNLDVNKNWDEKYSLLFRNKVDNKVYGIEYMLKFDEGYNSRLILSLNEEKYGYSLQSKYYRQSKSLILEGYFGKLVSSLCVELDTSRPKLFLAELVSDSSKPSRKLVIELENQISHSQENIYTFRLTHDSLEKPIETTLSFVNTENRRGGKLTLDYLRDPSKKIIINAHIESKDDSNFIYAFHVYQNDRRNLDAGIDGQVSLWPILTWSYNWHWINRNYQKKTGSYLLKIDLNKQEFYSVSKKENQTNVISGELETQNERTSLVGKIKSNGFERAFNVSIHFRRPLCIDMTVFDHVILIYRINFCVSNEGNRLLKFIIESYDHLTKSTDASIIFEKDRRKLYGSVHWKNKSLGSVLTLFNKVIRKRHTFEINEIKDELRRTQNTIGSEFFEKVYSPLSSSLSREYEHFSYESGLNTIKEQVSKYAEKHLPSINSIKSFLRIDFAIKTFKENLKHLVKICRQNSICPKVIATLVNYYYKQAQEEVRKRFKNILSVINKVNQFNKSVMKYSCKLMEEVKSVVSGLFEPVSSRLTHVTENIVNDWKIHIQSLQYNTKILVSKIINVMEQIAKKNSDLKALYKIITNILKEINNELRKADFDKIYELISEAKKTIFSPEKWASQLPFFQYDLEDGEINFEIWSPNVKSDFTNVFNYETAYEKIYDQINSLKSNVIYMMASPFKARAMIVSGKHFITFDNKFYDFARSGCTYLLARDFVDNNFTLSVKYYGHKNGKIMKSLILTLKDQLIEVSNQEKYVKVMNKYAELPYHHNNLSIVREGKHINVDDKYGVRLECDTDYDICTLSLAGWYFGKIKGMFGTYDHESSNDMKTPYGKEAVNVEELAKGWQVDRSCVSENILSNNEVIEEIEEIKETVGYTLCENLFKRDNSSLRTAFSLVDPKNYMELCLRTMKTLKGKKESEKAVCTVAAAYVTSLKHFNLEISIPKECLSCDGIEFGSRIKLRESSQKKADIIFVTEENKCNENITQYIEDISRYIWLGLRSENVDTKFGLIGMGSSFEQGKVHKHTTNGEILFDAKNIRFAARKVSHYPEYHEADAFEAIAQAAEYPFRIGASKNIILITCSKCSTKSIRMDYTDIHRMLRNEGITLHVINKEPIEVKGSSKKSRELFAVDSDTVYRKSDLRSTEFKGQLRLRSQVKIPENVCIVLAHESNGSYFSTAQMVNNEKEWCSLVARRVAKTAKPQSCQKCDCVLDRDLIHSKTICRPCKSSSKFL